MPISSKVASYLERGSFIRRMFEEGARLKAEHGEDKVFDFSLGNPPEEPPEAFHRELRRIVEEPIAGMHRYMPNAGFTWVREAVARTVAEESGLKVEAMHVVMTVGAGAALNVALKALLDPGEEVILLAPYFVEYGFYVENHGGRPVVVPTGEGFQLDLGAIDRAITERTKAVILNSPNNPTGVVYPEEQIRGLGELLRRRGASLWRDIYLISDEPYKRLIYDGVSYPQVFPHVDNAIIAMSHSKDLALAGERIGYLAVSPRCADVERLLDAMVFANRTLGFVNAPAMMQVLAARLQGVTIDIASYQRRRDMLYHGLTSLGFETNKPQGAFYLFPKSPIADDVAFVQAAQKRLILVVPGSGFGCPGFFRIAYSVPEGMIERSMGAWAALAQEFRLGGKKD
ncbi:MAG: pyridoxal phosphate-dependent aminotransferase [Thermodesulfobacteriota bacterium]